MASYKDPGPYRQSPAETCQPEVRLEYYFATVRPTHHADIIVHNDEPQLPVWQTRTH